MVADIEELETVDALEIYAKRLNAMEVIFLKEKWKMHISSRRWTKKIVGGDQELRTSTSIRERPIRGDVT